MKRANSEAAKDLRREQIIHAGLDEFFERGFSSAKMDNIARRAGVSKGTLYLYFASKEALFLDIIKAVAIPRVEMMESMMAQSSGFFSTLNMLSQQLPLLVRQSSVPKVAKVLIGDAFAFPAVVREYRQQVIERGHRALTIMVRKGCETGEIHTEDAENVARLMIAPVIFSAIWTVVFEPHDDEALDLQALFQCHQQMLMKALRPEAP